MTPFLDSTPTNSAIATMDATITRAYYRHQFSERGEQNSRYNNFAQANKRRLLKEGENRKENRLFRTRNLFIYCNIIYFSSHKF